MFYLHDFYDPTLFRQCGIFTAALSYYSAISHDMSVFALSFTENVEVFYNNGRMMVRQLLTEVK